ncbi:DUF5686 and carboxypeptidase regulatory-like domain-containing protein [Prolixibacteraceae bacterium Z1-6]|uniref:DUF5686 and carboxypeptidase regulatory-like domain-containing protein n=1 Tax=Draconibacterium aestuarii TaxID=2998507 RepID=A0A9X3F9I9_9BACT|nr:DUF5686 and carboxypeptidase regulatory-like domain-containing protein [Prolixibacteraceae bacterium Z1-6]
MFTKANIHTGNTVLYKFLLLLSFALTSFISEAQTISGIITDEQNQPIPYATIFISEVKEGTTSNVDGLFEFVLPKGNYNLTIRSMGYYQQIKTISLQTDSLYLPITLKTQSFEIKEVKVFPGKEDPAYFIMRKAMAEAPFYRKKIKHYSADLYIKSNFSFSNIPNVYKNKITMDDGKKLKDYFKENVTYVIESHNKINYDYPNNYDQQVISKKTSLVGFDEPPVMGLITTSIYEERPFQTISPLSSMALKHYNFQYEGYITVDGSDVFKIRVIPKRNSDELVDGYIYIVNKLWCVYNMDFKSSFEFFNLRVKQQFQHMGAGNWLPVTYNISGNVSMLGLRGTFYYGASVKYHSIEDNYFNDAQQERVLDSVVKAPQKVRQKSEKEVELTREVELINAKKDLSNRDIKKVSRLNRKIVKEQYQDSTIIEQGFDTYNIKDEKDSLVTNIEWDTIRLIPLTPAEIRSYEMADSIVRLETASKDDLSDEEKVIRKKANWNKFGFGVSDFCKDSLIRLGYDGLLTVENFDFNSVDGYKYKQTLRFRYTLDKNKYISATSKIGYAFNRKAIFGEINSHFNNVLGEGNRLSINAGKMSTDFKGYKNGISPLVNAVSSWFFAENYMKLYESTFLHINASQRFKKDFTILADVEYDHFYPLENNISYPLSNSKEYSPNIPKGYAADHPALLEQKSFTYQVGLNYRKRLRKPWLATSPFLFMSDFYTFNLSYKQGVSDIFNSEADFSRIDFYWRQQANLSPSAGIDWYLNAGYYFNADQLHFSQYKHLNTSEILVETKSFTNTFQLLNDYQFSTKKSYLTVGADYRTEYLLLRYFSFINKKTWSESFHFNYLTTPALENYWEAGYSLNSLFFVGNIGVFAGFKGSNFESVSVKATISVFE